jgi:hypothetical protein
MSVPDLEPPASKMRRRCEIFNRSMMTKSPGERNERILAAYRPYPIEKSRSAGENARKNKEMKGADSRKNKEILIESQKSKSRIESLGMGLNHIASAIQAGSTRPASSVQ